MCFLSNFFCFDFVSSCSCNTFDLWFLNSVQEIYVVFTFKVMIFWNSLGTFWSVPSCLTWSRFFKFRYFVTRWGISRAPCGWSRRRKLLAMLAMVIKVAKMVKVAMVANSGGPPCSRRCFPTVIRILSCSCLGAEERRRERQGPTPPCTTLVYSLLEIFPCWPNCLLRLGFCSIRRTKKAGQIMTLMTVVESETGQTLQCFLSP